jgi:hypothetical protein
MIHICHDDPTSRYESYSISLFSFAAWGLNHCTWKTLADHKCKLSFFNVFQVEKKDLETIDRELA